jgi:Bax protein
MHLPRRTRLRDRFLLICPAALVAGLFALVWSGIPSPRLPAPAVPPVARGSLAPEGGAARFSPPAAHLIRQEETRKAQLLQAAFDRIGFDLGLVARGYISVPAVVVASLPPDLDQLDSLDDHKALFLRTLLPVVLRINDQIGTERQALLALSRKIATGVPLTGSEVQWVLALADAYDQPDADIAALLAKVDVIPPSIALAQAIEESGWGTSRLARERNALFGQFGQASSGDWDYRRFTDLTEAVGAYARNLNTHRAYREFRQVRLQMRQTQGEIDAWQLAATLHRYSERGDGYVQSLRAIMDSNGLENFDAARVNGSGRTASVAIY